MSDVEVAAGAPSPLSESLSAQQKSGTRRGVVVLRLAFSQACDPDLVVAPAVRAEDVVTSLDGEGVVILFGDARGIDDAVSVAERVRRLLHRWAVSKGYGICEISAGAAVTADGEDVETVRERAERALAQARDSGGDRTVARSRTRIPRQIATPGFGGYVGAGSGS